jgi:hypothetical protein
VHAHAQTCITSWARSYRRTERVYTLNPSHTHHTPAQLRSRINMIGLQKWHGLRWWQEVQRSLGAMRI